jgi:hypothetical protein
MTREEAKQILGALVYEHTTPAQTLHAVETAIDGILALERSVAERCAEIAEGVSFHHIANVKIATGLDSVARNMQTVIAASIRKEFGLEEKP